MRKRVCWARLLLLALTASVCLGTVALAAEKPDYDDLFARAADEKDFFVDDQLADALIHDPEGFLENLAFREVSVQQAVLDKMFRGENLSVTRTQYTVMDYLVRELFWEYYEVGKYPSESYRTIFLSMNYELSYKIFSLPEEYEDCASLFALAGKTDGAATEEWVMDLAAAIKGDPIGFVRTLAAQDSAMQESVIGSLGYHDSWAYGNVLADILRSIRGDGSLTDAEEVVVDAMLSQLAEVVYVVPVGPDPVELAQRQQETEPAVEPTAEPVTEPSSEPVTEPSSEPVIEPETTEPVEQEEKDGNGSWVVLLTVGAAVAGFLVGELHGRMRK